MRIGLDGYSAEPIDAVGYGSSLLGGGAEEPFDLSEVEQTAARATSDDDRSDSTTILLGVPESRAARRPPLPTGVSVPSRTRGAASESASFGAPRLSQMPLSSGVDASLYATPLELSISTASPPKSALTRSYTPSHTYLGSSTTLPTNYRHQHNRSGTASSALTPPAAQLNKFSMSTLALSAPAASAKAGVALSSESELSDLELDSKAASRGRGAAGAGHHVDYLSTAAYGSGGAQARTVSQSTGLASHYLSHGKYGSSGGRTGSHSPAPSSSYFSSATALSKTPIPLAGHYIDRPALQSVSGARSVSPTRSYVTPQSRVELERQGRESSLSRLNLALAADEEAALSPALDAYGRSTSPMGHSAYGAADSFSNFSAGGTQQKPYAPRTPADVHMGDYIKFCRHGGRVSRGRVMFIGSLPGRHDVYLGVELENEGLPTGFAFRINFSSIFIV